MAKKTFDDYHLRQDWDDLLLAEDMGAILDECDNIVQEFGGMIRGFIDILDPNQIPLYLLDLALLGKGIDTVLDFPDVQMSEIDKRKLLALAVRIFQQKGTAPGIANIIRLLLKVDVQVIQQYNVDTWKLGFDGSTELGDTTILGLPAGGPRSALYSFDIQLAEPLDCVVTMAKIRAISDYMKPAHTKLVNIYPPEPPLDHWELGLSELGETTFLHEAVA